MNLLSRRRPGHFPALLALLASCAPAAEAPVRFLIGVSQANLSEPWRVSMTDEVQRQAALHPELRIIVADASDSLGKQIGDVEKFEGLGIDLLIISPLESEALTPTVTRVYQKIPVIVLNRSVANYDYSVFIGPDNARIGQEAGRFVAGLLKDDGGQVLEVLGRSGSPPTLERAEGFRQELAKNPLVHLQSPVLANWLRDGAEDLVADRLKADGPPRVIFAHNDAMAYGAWLAAQKLRLADRITFLGVDGLPGPRGGQELLRNGILNATFVSPTGGQEAVEYALAILNHRGEQPKKVILGTRFLTRQGLDQGPVSGLEVRGPLKIAYRWSDGRGAGLNRLRDSVLRALNSRQWTALEVRNDPPGLPAGVSALVVETGGFSTADRSARLALEAEASARGVPVVRLGPQPPSGDEGPWTLALGADPLEEGRRAGRWLAGERVRRVVHLAQGRDAAGTDEAARGLIQGLAERGEALVTATLTFDGTRSSARRAVSRALEEGLPFDGVLAQGEEAALGTADAVADHPSLGSVPRHIVAVGDGTALEAALADGKVGAVVRRPSDLGPLLRSHLEQALAEPGVSRRLVVSHDVLSRP